MEKRKLSKLGVETSLLGYGCMRFPQTKEGTIDEEKAEALLDKAYASGVTYFDTAYGYHNGESEKFVGKAMKKYPRDSFYLATKLPLWKVKSIEDAKAIFAEQLERLQTDYVDFYLMHAVNKESWDAMRDMGIVELLKGWKAEGKFRYLGFSFHDSYEVFEEVINYTDWDFCQIQLNYLDTEEQAGMKGYELTAAKEIPLVIMEPVKGGTLAAFSEDITAKFRGLDENATPASYALRWVGSLPNVKVVLSGMTTMEQVEDNLQTFGSFVPLNETEKETIEEIVNIMKSRVQNGCTGCSYCMPCPAGVNIPKSFRLWNTYHKYQNYNMVKDSWEEMPECERPANCIKCGKCETLCPQALKIREDLMKAQEDLDKKEMAF